MRLVLSGNPISTNTLYRRHGHFIYMTKEGKELKKSYAKQAREQWTGGVMGTPVKVWIDLFFKDKRRRDIDNWHKILLDSLTGIIWKDDSQIEEMRVRKLSGEPRIEIELLELIKNQCQEK